MPIIFEILHIRFEFIPRRLGYWDLNFEKEWEKYGKGHEKRECETRFGWCVCHREWLVSAIFFLSNLKLYSIIFFDFAKESWVVDLVLKEIWVCYGIMWWWQVWDRCAFYLSFFNENDFFCWLWYLLFSLLICVFVLTNLQLCHWALFLEGCQ